MSRFSYDPRQVISIYRPLRNRMGTEGNWHDEEFVQTASCVFYEGTPMERESALGRIFQRRGAVVCGDRAVDVQLGDSIQIASGTWFSVVDPPSVAAGVAWFMEERPNHG